MTIEHISQCSDEELVESFKNTKKDKFFDEIFDRFSDRMFGKCLTFFKDIHEAQDCVQDIFMKILLNIDSFKGNSKFSTWVYSITYNYCVDRSRALKRNPLDFQDEIYEGCEEDESEIEDKVLLEMELERLDKALDAIPTKDKAILLMKYLDGMAIKEIGDSIDKSESAVKMQIKRAKSKCVQAHDEIFRI